MLWRNKTFYISKAYNCYSPPHGYQIKCHLPLKFPQNATTHHPTSKSMLHLQFNLKTTAETLLFKLKFDHFPPLLKTFQCLFRVSPSLQMASQDLDIKHGSVNWLMVHLCVQPTAVRVIFTLLSSWKKSKSSISCDMWKLYGVPTVMSINEDPLEHSQVHHMHGYFVLHPFCMACEANLK